MRAEAERTFNYICLARSMENDSYLLRVCVCEGIHVISGNEDVTDG